MASHGCVIPLRLSTSQFDGERLLKRLTMVVRDGRVEHVFYPIFHLTATPNKFWAGSPASNDR
ncbi:MAG TPA: hypothetical protein VFR33_12210 [Candidatus Dormibacteraeota bacterium]|nr:hypothetical protein [Candidatus Dormibacteraeota bacterium]